MLRLGGHGIGGIQVLALKSPDPGPGKFGGQEGVLAVVFLHAAVPGVPAQIHHRGEQLADAPGPGFRGRGPAHPVTQLRIKGGGQTDLLGEAGGVPGQHAVEGLLAEKEGDAQPGFLHRVALDLVDLPGGQATGLDRADAQTAEDGLQLLRLHRQGVTIGVPADKAVGRILIRLSDQLLQGHPGDQIIKTRFNGKVRILIGKHRGSSSYNILSLS